METIPLEFRRAYLDYNRELTIRKNSLGCLIGILLVPTFSLADYYMYPKQAGFFLTLRLACSVVMAGLYPVFNTRFGRKYYRVQGLLVLLMPVATIAYMIYVTDGAASRYYAGLNLVLMVLAVVLDWTFWQSVASILLVILLYLAASLPSVVDRNFDVYVSNLFFLVSTGIAIVTGAHYHSRIRIREFVSRCELDKSRKALEETNQKLRDLDHIKNQFFANISHELRTPLTLLIAPLETLLNRFEPGSETKELLATMHANGMRLLKLINDLLDLVRLESGRMEVKPEPIDVPEFIKGLASAAKQIADDKQLQLVTTVDPAFSTLLADRDKLEKILLNLLFNALKFTPSGGRVELRAEKLGEQLVLTVADTGMGISEKNLPFIFDRFWQADGSSKRKYQGVGIGLALVKELVQIQGGEVSVKSTEGQGTTFTVSLPFRAAAPPPSRPVEAEANATSPDATGTVSSEEWLANLYRRAELFPALAPLHEPVRLTESGANGSRRTILVADDEPDMMRFLKSQLALHFHVLEAVDGQQAVEKAMQFLPDIILLDMMMPEKDGLQVCREIREHAPSQSIPIVMLTARADEETKLAALSAGANDFLAKPFSTTELQVRLKNLVESFDYQRKLARQKQVLESTIEQLKETETQLVQSEKLASLGRMSAGIIHEINNPLNFATTGLFTLRNKGKHLAADQQEEYAEILRDVEEGIARVKNIVADLRQFTHPNVEAREQVEVAEAVGTALRFLSGEWKNEVTIVQNLAEHQTIWGNKNLLVHVMVNLLQNSLDALKEKRSADEKPTIWIEGRVESNQSVLCVRDNGSGIDPANLGKVFDPFFTTKDVGQGMGLGLAICYRIVQDCDGRISVRSEPGRFCEFTLAFPVKG
jgi:signal transduction histidine kinase